MGVAVSQTSVMLSHTLQFAVLLTTFTNLTQHMLYLCWRRGLQPRDVGSSWAQFGPAYAAAAATAFVMVEPTYLVFRFAGKVPAIITPLIRVCTVLGYVALTLATVWATDLWNKLRKAIGNGDAFA